VSATFTETSTVATAPAEDEDSSLLRWGADIAARRVPLAPRDSHWRLLGFHRACSIVRCCSINSGIDRGNARKPVKFDPR
jgi:hypothetical protein